MGKTLNKTLIVTLLMIFFACPRLCFAQELVIKLSSPKKSTDKVSVMRAIEKQTELSGTVTLDITPYPAQFQEGRYNAEYFLNNKLLYSTSGAGTLAGGQMSFKYEFDTTKEENGIYKIYVNFWDDQGDSSIGVKKVVINNIDTR
jgi:carbon monoxide dehydrogenase subunit G